MDNPEKPQTESQSTEEPNLTPPLKPDQEKQSTHKNPFVRLNWRRLFSIRTAVILLVLIIITLFVLWRLDQRSPNSNDRTVKVTGEATVSAVPDEYEFDPSYTFRNTDKGSAIAAATAKQTEIVNQLKKLGVNEKQIKNTLDGYEDYPPVYYNAQAPTTQTGDYVYTLSLTATVPNRTLAQQVQDYLTTTNPEGSVTPQISFSDTTRKKLESQARELASADAKSKADQSAKNLGFKVKNVKNVEDGTGFDDTGGCGPNGLCNGVSLDAGSNADQSLSLQPGQDKFTFTVDVTYYIR